MDNASNLSPQAVQKTISYRYVIFLVIALAYFFVYFPPGVAFRYGSGTNYRLQYRCFQPGFIWVHVFWAYALGQLPAGILADRIGIRGTLAIFML